MTGLERLNEFEQFAAKLREREKAHRAGVPAFPDPVGKTRDERRVIVWDLTR